MEVDFVGQLILLPSTSRGDDAGHFTLRRDSTRLTITSLTLGLIQPCITRYSNDNALIDSYSARWRWI